MLPSDFHLPPPDFEEIEVDNFWIKRRLRRARWWRRLQMNIHQVIDGVFKTFLTGYQLPHNSKWIWFANLFWIECPICFFYRGATFGFLLGVTLAAIVALIV